MPAFSTVAFQYPVLDPEIVGCVSRLVRLGLGRGGFRLLFFSRLGLGGIGFRFFCFAVFVGSVPKFGLEHLAQGRFGVLADPRIVRNGSIDGNQILPVMKVHFYIDIQSQAAAPDSKEVVFGIKARDTPQSNVGIFKEGIRDVLFLPLLRLSVSVCHVLKQRHIQKMQVVRGAQHVVPCQRRGVQLYFIFVYARVFADPHDEIQHFHGFVLGIPPREHSVVSGSGSAAGYLSDAPDSCGPAAFRPGRICLVFGRCVREPFSGNNFGIASDIPITALSHRCYPEAVDLVKPGYHSRTIQSLADARDAEHHAFFGQFLHFGKDEAAFLVGMEQFLLCSPFGKQLDRLYR